MLPKIFNKKKEHANINYAENIARNGRMRRKFLLEMYENFNMLIYRHILCDNIVSIFKSDGLILLFLEFESNP